MSGQILTALVTLLVAGGSGLGWWIRRRDTRRDPVLRTAAELALAKDALGIVEASRDTLVEDVARLKVDLTTDRDRLEALTVEVDSLRREVQTIRQMWSSWYADLRTRWEHHRAQAAPPSPPALD